MSQKIDRKFECIFIDRKKLYIDENISWIWLGEIDISRKQNPKLLDAMIPIQAE